MLKKEGPKLWIFEEYKDIMGIHFRFKDKEMPRSYVSNISTNLHVSRFVKIIHSTNFTLL